eukprot:PhM_4_TR17879/c0_g1_i1/m.11051
MSDDPADITKEIQELKQTIKEKEKACQDIKKACENLHKQRENLEKQLVPGLGIDRELDIRKQISELTMETTALQYQFTAVLKHSTAVQNRITTLYQAKQAKTSSKSLLWMVMDFWPFTFSSVGHKKME